MWKTILLLWKTVVHFFSFSMGFPDGTSGKESACQCRRHKRCEFDRWVRRISWNRKWQLTLVFLPGKSHGQKNLAGYSPWGRIESDMTEQGTLTNQPNMQKTFRGLFGLFFKSNPMVVSLSTFLLGAGAELLLPWYCALLMLPLKVWLQDIARICLHVRLPHYILWTLGRTE